MPNSVPALRVGQRLGRLTVVIPHVKVEGQQKPQVIVSCSCGSGLIEKAKRHVVSGATQSCGCGQGFYTHGGVNTPEYGVWKAMKQRCYMPNSRMFRFYGAKGVTVCDRWRDSFENFIKDMGPRPTAAHSIERVDVEQGYCPENCIWATRREQDRNRRNNVFVVYKGQRMVLADAAQASGISPKTLGKRVRAGCSPETLFDPPETTRRGPKTARTVMYQGQEMTLSDAAKASGISKVTLDGRIRKGWPEEQLFSPAVKGLRPGRRPAAKARG